MKALQSLNKYFWKYRWRLGLGFLFIILTNLFAVYAPVLIGEGVSVLRNANERYFDPLRTARAEDASYNADDLVTGEDLELPASLQWISENLNLSSDATKSLDTFDQALMAIVQVGVLLALLYIGTYLLKGLFLFFTRQTIIVMSRLIEYDQKNEIYDHYQRLSMAFYKRNNTGDLMNRISEDVSKVRMYLGPAVMYTLNLVVLMVLVVTVMLMTDVELTLYALLPLPFMSISIYYVSNIMNRRSEAVQRQQSKLSTIVQESISGIRVLKAYHRQEYSETNFQKESDLYKVKALAQVKVDALFMPIIVLLVGLSTILTIYIGGQKVMAGELGMDKIFTFVFYVNLLTWPFASVGWVTSLVQKAEASQARINEFLKQRPDIENYGKRIPEIKGNIAFKNVSFVYPDSGIKALDNVSFELNAGETLAIIGRTGSGKSTIANLVARQYDPTDGEIFIDGKPLPNHNLYQVRENIGYVPQEVFLFSESIFNNIKFGVDDANTEAVEQAAKDAQVHENIIDFPKKYETVLGERGINLSGGQKQRISIARAIIKNPKILMFDDCLSAVDTETEEAILNNLKRMMNGRSSLIISHRVSSIKHADKILVMDDGKIIEQGDHKSLLDKDGVYAELYRKQLTEEAA
ncbi:MAG: ABC transporter ATP-binding protein/permease [Flavobacteriales bacterium]|nr:ABC transporter ATP-binding protein/permease [Flavobacteriales bacterium]